MTVRPLDSHVLVTDEKPLEIHSSVLETPDLDPRDPWLIGVVQQSAAYDIAVGEKVIYRSLSGKMLDKDAKQRLLHEDEVAFVLED